MPATKPFSVIGKPRRRVDGRAKVTGQTRFADDIVLRTSASRTMTRPNPSSMLPATTFTDISAQVANQGNPDLTPYISTNFDIGGEWYTGGEGFVGMTLFNVADAEFVEIHAALIAGLENGTLSPLIGRELPLAEAARAHEAVMEPGALGKTVLLP